MLLTKAELLTIVSSCTPLNEAEKERVGVGAGAKGGGSTSASSSKKSSSESSPATGEVGTVKGSKKISSLAPDAQPVFKEFIQKANAAGYTIIITSARRVPSHQWNLRYRGGGITPAQPCRSDHQYGYALDINAAYTDSNGKKKSIRSKSSDAAWKPIVNIANSVGLKWQGAKDRVHFYMKSVPGSTKDQCKQYYEKEGGKPLAKLGSKFMKHLEQNPQKNATIKKILKLPNIEMFAENNRRKIKVTREELEFIINEVLNISEAEKERKGVGAGADGGSEGLSTSGKQSPDTEKAGGSSYAGPLVTDKGGGKKYLGKPGVGVSNPGYWDGFRSEFESFINQNYPELGLRVDNLGVSRDLEGSANPSSSARAAGSKHGAGMAQDLYLHTDKYGKFTSFKSDNKKLAKDPKLVTLIRQFVAGKPELKWGGDFGGGSGDRVKGRGITEFHHFEIVGSKIPDFFKGNVKDVESEIAKTSYGQAGGTVDKLTNTKELGKLYKALA